MSSGRDTGSVDTPPPAARHRRRHHHGSGQQPRAAQQVEQLARRTHFQRYEVECLLADHQQLMAASGAASGAGSIVGLERSRFRETLHSEFGMTDDRLMDRVFRVFDADSDGQVGAVEWVVGLSAMLRGTLSERVDFCFRVYDYNGDRSLAREEVHHLLRDSLVRNPQEEDPDEAVRDLVDIVMRKMDMDRDGFVSYDDYQAAVRAEPLTLEAFGPCLPKEQNAELFLSRLVARSSAQKKAAKK